MKRAYRIAVVCGATPLLLGLLLFLLWIVTKGDGLMDAGIAAIYAGLAFFAIGIVALGRFLWLGLRTTAGSRQKLCIDSAAALLLLLTNFPVAWGIVGAVVAIETRYTVVVRNESSQPLEHVRLFGGGTAAAIFSIPPHTKAERTLWFQREGELNFEASLGNAAIAHPLAGYVTRGMGGRAEVLVDARGKVEVTLGATKRWR